ncbi:hypothetical protein CONPUDRAFT_160779 [Coniophora puteana RWD-64-598 SS2]|uniref:Uncharacterized protein n=1 Tax=Coniophora puteana (strain RWD-64-598) TaxID=741705 RepID=R7SF79_CONPW|nr:uncharacterized protein CONPUDRAFT_160779 [Coniophora puteana RWD-64-598 SS2]EIW73729.1 hypothetical protein CONPUDRAFT_160779 [Coniophora puteana RWD-64-598 SS2]
MRFALDLDILALFGASFVAILSSPLPLPVFAPRIPASAELDHGAALNDDSTLPDSVLVISTSLFLLPTFPLTPPSSLHM